jgi:hypothetical protein
MDGIRKAKTAADISHVVRLVGKLIDSVKGAVPMDVSHTGAQIARLTQAPTGLVLVSERGFIAAEVLATVVSPAPIAFEQGWYAEDGKGMKLLDCFERWSDEMQCVGRKLSTASNVSCSMRRALVRRGYSPAEMAWYK